MTTNQYHLVSNWRILGTPEELFSIIAEQEQLSSWWPACFREVLEIDPGAPDGIGRILRMETRGWLPYVQRWHLRVERIEAPRELHFQVWGDLEGYGAWTLDQDGIWTNVTHDWQVDVKKGLMRSLSLAGRPLFIANHRWAMAQGEESLHREANRRRHAGNEDAALIPPPPGPAKSSGRVLLSAAVAAGGLLVMRRRSQRTS